MSALSAVMESREPMWIVMARRLQIGSTEYYELPVFYLDPRAQNIGSRKDARRVAAEILGADQADVDVRFEVHRLI